MERQTFHVLSSLPCLGCPEGKSIIERTAGKDRRRDERLLSLSLFTHKTMSVKVDSLVLFSFRSREEKYYKTKTTTSSSPGILFLFSSSPPATSIPLFFFFLSWKVSFLKSGLELRSLPSSLSLPPSLFSSFFFALRKMLCCFSHDLAPGLFLLPVKRLHGSRRRSSTRIRDKEKQESLIR